MHSRGKYIEEGNTKQCTTGFNTDPAAAAAAAASAASQIGLLAEMSASGQNKGQVALSNENNLT